MKKNNNLKNKVATRNHQNRAKQKSQNRANA